MKMVLKLQDLKELKIMDNIQFDPEKHEYSRDGIIIPGVTTVIGNVGIYDYNQYVTTEKGDRVHEIMKNYIEGCLDYEKLTDEDIKLVERFDELTRGFKFNICEKRVGNELYNYVGTCDYLSNQIIGELKTGKPEKWHIMQLAAYVYCFEKKQGVLIYIFEKKDPIRIYDRSELKDIFQIFLCALQVYCFKEVNKK